MRLLANPDLCVGKTQFTTVMNIQYINKSMIQPSKFFDQNILTLQRCEEGSQRMDMSYVYFEFELIF
jgi:hypothetical protein